MKIKTGLTYEDTKGIKCNIEIETYTAIYPYQHKVIKVWGKPDKKSDKYYEIKRELGDDWVNDITNNWWELNFIPLKKQYKLATILDEYR